MLNWLKKQLAAPVFPGEEEKTRVAALLNTVLWSALFILVVAGPVLVVVNETPRDVQLTLMLVGGFALALLGLLHLLRRGVVRIASTLFCSLLWLFVFATTLVFGGIRSSITPAYLLTIFIAGFLLREQGAVLFGVLSIGAIFGVYAAEFYFDAVLRLPRPRVALDNAFMLAATFGWMTVMVVLGWRNFASALERARRNEKALHERVQELRESRENLEARTRELEQRTIQLQTAAEVGRDVTSVSDLDPLLTRVVELIEERFGFYHVALFLVDDTGEYAMLRTAAGHAAEAVIAEGMRLRVGQQGLVGRVTARGEARVAQDVQQDPLYIASPLLEGTRSEAILPLQAGSDIIGALDVQSQELHAFPKADVAVLQIVADQMAVAIENARLLAEMRATVQDLRAASGQYTRSAWQTAAEGRGGRRGYRSDHTGAILPSDVKASEEEGRGELEVPLQLREQMIGMLNLRFASEDVPTETKELIEGVAERLVLSLENARLLEASRQRAAHERLVGDIAAELRAAVDVEGVLRRTIQQLGRALGAQATVRMVPAQHAGEDDGAGKEV